MRTCPCVKMLAHLVSVPSPVETTMDLESLRAENNALRARMRELEDELQRLQRTAHTDHLSSGESRTDSPDYFAVLHETALAIMSRLDLNDVLETIMMHAARLAGANDGFIDLLSPDGTLLEMKIGIGKHARNRGSVIAISEGISGRVCQTGAPMMVEDYRNWEGRVRSIDTSDFGTVIAVPLRLRSAIIGVLGVSYGTPTLEGFESIVTLLMRFAELAAIAIDNARLYTIAQEELAERRRIENEVRANEQRMRDLYAVTRRQAQELHLIGQVREAMAREIDLPALFRTVVESIAATFGYSLVCLYLRDGDELALQHQVGYAVQLDRIPLGRGVISRTILSGRATLIADVRSDPDFIGVMDNIVSEICVPLRDQDRVIGTLNIESTDGMVLTDDDLRVMTELAEHINVAIERARLYEQLWRRVQQLDVLYDIMTDITGNLDRDTVLKAIVERTIALLRVTHGMIALYDPEQNNLQIHYSVGMNRDYAGMRIAPGEGVIGRVAQTRQPLVVYDYNRWEGRTSLFQEMPSSNVLGVPLLSGDELIGTLSAGDFNLKRVFTDDDIRLLSIFAQQATIAIKNARLFAEVQHLAITDPLMGIYNRRYFFSAATREYERARRHHHPLAVIIADLDDFKQINDRYGHPVGDRVLQEVSSVFRRELRSIDLLARYGGEEIVMLLPETECSGVITVVERLRSRLMSAIPTERGDVHITASFGAAVSQRIRTPDVETLIACADQALLYAKQQGKDRLVIWCDRCDVAGHCPHIAPHMSPPRVSTIFLSPGKPDESV
jgi:diguanylate cyclase (GGDEF)-like protein